MAESEYTEVSDWSYVTPGERDKGAPKGFKRTALRWSTTLRKYEHVIEYSDHFEAGAPFGTVGSVQGSQDYEIPRPDEGGGEAGVSARHTLDLAQRERFKQMDVEQESLQRETQLRIVAIQDARRGIDQEIDRERLALDEAKHTEDLTEQIRHSQILEGLYTRDRELAQAQFDWSQQTDTAKLGLEEHRNRIQEAGVTGYYRPTATTPFSRPVSPTALAAAAPTLGREQYQSGQAQQPGGFYGGLPQPGTAPAPPPPQSATPSPVVDTRNTPLADLADVFKTPQTGPKAQGTASQAPNAQPNEADINAAQRVVKRTVTEVFG